MEIALEGSVAPIQLDTLKIITTRPTWTVEPSRSGKSTATGGKMLLLLRLSPTSKKKH